MHKIVREAIVKASELVVDQARYINPGCIYNEDYMDLGALAVTDETINELWQKPILSTRNLTKLVVSMGLDALYSDKDWMDPVADYIVKHQADCTDLWDKMEYDGERMMVASTR